MTKIYTKTGDSGETSLFANKRVKKCCLEMEAIGEVDELNAALGLVTSRLREGSLKNKLLKIQNKLFVIGSNLAALQTDLKEVPKLDIDDVEFLEDWIDGMDKDLKKLNTFILPGGHVLAAQSYLARTACRRAERQLIKLSESYEVDPLIKQYLNRLSDLLFVLGRWINMKSGVEDVVWKK